MAYTGNTKGPFTGDAVQRTYQPVYFEGTVYNDDDTILLDCTGDNKLDLVYELSKLSPQTINQRFASFCEDLLRTKAGID